MPAPEDRSDAYQAAARDAAGWIAGHWDPGLTVRAWWALLAGSGWGFPFSDLTVGTRRAAD